MNIGDLVVRLRADLADFSAGIGKGIAGLKEFSGAAEREGARAGRAMRGAGAQIAAGLGVTDAQKRVAQMEALFARTATAATAGGAAARTFGQRFGASMTAAAASVQGFAGRTYTYLQSAGNAVGRFVTGSHPQLAKLGNAVSGLAGWFLHLGTTITRALLHAIPYLNLGILGLSAAIIKIGADAEESDNLFAVSFGDMADSVRAWSQELAERLHLSETAIRKSAATFNLFLTTMGLGEKPAAQFAQAMTEVAYAISKLRMLKPEEAMEKLQGALAGQPETLKRLGIAITDSTLALWAQKNGLDANVTSWSEAQKVIARMGVIMESTTKDMGDLARTQGSTTNLLRSIKDQFLETASAIYDRWRPYVQGALSGLRDWLEKNRQAIAAWAGGAMDSLATFADWLKTDWAGAVKAGFEVVLTIAKTVLSALQVLFEATFKYIASHIGGWLAEGLDAAIQNLPAAFAKIDWSQVLKAWPFGMKADFWSQLLGNAGTAGEDLTTRLSAVMAQLKTDLAGIMAQAPSAAGGIGEMTAALEGFYTVVEGGVSEDTVAAFDNLASAAGNAGQGIAAAMDNAAGGIGKTGEAIDGVKAALAATAAAFKKEGEDAKAAAEAAASAWRSFAKGMFDLTKTADVIAGAWESAGSRIGGAMEDAFVTITKDIHNAGDAAKAMVDAIMEAISRAIFQTYVLKSITGAVEGIGSWFGGGETGPSMGSPGTGGYHQYQEGGLIGQPKGRMAGFTPKGTDTVPIMATPGELMLPVSLVQWFKHALTGSSSVQQATQYKGVGGLIQTVTDSIRTVAQTFTSRASVLRERATETLVQYKQAGGVIAALAQRAAPLAAMPVPVYLQAGGLIEQLEAGTVGAGGNGGAVLRVVHEQAEPAVPQIGAAQVSPSPMSGRPIQISVSAIDAAGVYQFFEKNKRAIASMVLDAESSNHPSRRAFGGRR